jgi:hypothetical protein
MFPLCQRPKWRLRRLVESQTALAARGCRAVRPETPQGSARPRRWRPTCWPFRLGERPSLWTGRAVTMVASRATGAGPSGQPGPGRHGADMSSRGTDLEKDDLGSGRVWKRCRGVSTSSAEMAGHDNLPRYTSEVHQQVHRACGARALALVYLGREPGKALASATDQGLCGGTPPGTRTQNLRIKSPFPAVHLMPSGAPDLRLVRRAVHLLPSCSAAYQPVARPTRAPDTPSIKEAVQRRRASREPIAVDPGMLYRAPE